MTFKKGNNNQQLRELCRKRRSALCDALNGHYKDFNGSILFFAGFEREGTPFIQESSFYYYTGIQEPGAVLEIDQNGLSTLFFPHYSPRRSQWVTEVLLPGQETAHLIGVDACRPLGDEYDKIAISPFASQKTFKNVLVLLEEKIQKKQKIYTLNFQGSETLSDERIYFDRISNLLPELASHVVDITAFVARQRRKKDLYELEQLYNAVQATYDAHEAAAMVIAPGISEAEVKAAAEYALAMRGSHVGYPTIAATGSNATILHHTTGMATLEKDDLLLLDCGGLVDHYAADISRTFPVSGVFSKRQRELYEIVLDAQEYIASLAKPGMYLHSSLYKDRSLNHLARSFFEEKGYGAYFNHGIGHFLGLNVHDIGDGNEPLDDGDVITIEPGLYIPEERIGIRIEDDYWIIKDGCECLSAELPKTPHEVEALMKDVRKVSHK